MTSRRAGPASLTDYGGKGLPLLLTHGRAAVILEFAAALAP